MIMLAAELLWREEPSANGGASRCACTATTAGAARFTPPEPGRYLFAIEAWTDQFATWRNGFVLKREAGPGRRA